MVTVRIRLEKSFYKLVRQKWWKSEKSAKTHSQRRTSSNCHLFETECYFRLRFSMSTVNRRHLADRNRTKCPSTPFDNFGRLSKPKMVKIRGMTSYWHPIEEDDAFSNFLASDRLKGVLRQLYTKDGVKISIRSGLTLVWKPKCENFEKWQFWRFLGFTRSCRGPRRRTERDLGNLKTVWRTPECTLTRGYSVPKPPSPEVKIVSPSKWPKLTKMPKGTGRRSPGLEVKPNLAEWFWWARIWSSKG